MARQNETFKLFDYQLAFDKLNEKYPELTEIDYTSAVKASQLANKWISELKALVPVWFEKIEDRTELMKALNGLKVKKVQLMNGRLEIKAPKVN